MPWEQGDNLPPFLLLWLLMVLRASAGRSFWGGEEGQGTAAVPWVQTPRVGAPRAGPWGHPGHQPRAPAATCWSPPSGPPGEE